MRRKRKPLMNMKAAKYVHINEYFGTPTGSKVLEFMKAKKPIVMIFLTSGGYIIDTIIKEFENKEINDSIPPMPEPPKEIKPKPDIQKVEVDPVFERPPDPMEDILYELEDDPTKEAQPNDNSDEVNPGDTVKCKRNGQEDKGVILEIVDENTVKIETMFGVETVNGNDLISLIKE